MTKIKLPAIFGTRSKSRLIKDNGISITLEGDMMITRTCYTYEQPKIDDDEMSGYEEVLCNEKAYNKREHITQVGAGYDEKENVYYVGVMGIGFNAYINVESIEKANEVMETIVKWWGGSNNE